MAGHDHSRQRLNEPGALCGAEPTVSGAGAKATSIDNPERIEACFQDAAAEGFMHVVFDGNSLYGCPARRRRSELRRTGLVRKTQPDAQPS